MSDESSLSDLDSFDSLKFKKSSESESSSYYSSHSR